MADSDIDLSDDDLDPLSVEQCRDKLSQLVEERKRKRQLEDRLLLKMKGLSEQLSEQRDSVEGLYRTLEQEKGKVENETRARKAEHEKRLGEMDVRIRKYMTELIFRTKPPEEEDLVPGAGGGGAGDAGGAAIVPAGMTKGGTTTSSATSSSSSPVLPMVLISYFKPGTSERCDLRYRVNRYTTVRQLRFDVCKYWQLDSK